MALNKKELAEIKEELRRCSPETLKAALRFREKGDKTAIPTVVYGLLERYQPAPVKLPLKEANNDTRLIEDLGLDSLALLEVVFAIEGVLKLHINNEELKEIRTLGKLNQFLRDKIAKVSPAAP
jgi:3-hydroxyacyl-[acyl-carrier-protein] dehydratase